MDRKIILSVFVGIFSAGIATLLLLPIGQLIFPVVLPEGYHEFTKEAKREFQINLPVVHFIALIVIQGIGVVIGQVAGRMIFKNTIYPIIVILVIMLMMNFINDVQRPYPSWLVFADLGFTALLGTGYILMLKKS